MVHALPGELSRYTANFMTLTGFSEWRKLTRPAKKNAGSKLNFDG